MINKTLLKRTFGRAARFYDTYASVQNLTARTVLEKIAPCNIHSILEIGCGTGNYTKLLHDRFPRAKLTAVDISPEMIAQAKKKLKPSAVEFIVDDAEEIDTIKHFDLITSNATVQWFKDLKCALTKYKQLLNERGKIYFSTFGPLTFYELQESLKAFDAKICVAAENFIDKDALKKILRSQFTYTSVQEATVMSTYQSLKELLECIKYTSGVHSGSSKIWTRHALNGLEKIYLKKYKRIAARYQVFLCHAE
ncbi:MAG: malonyl-ACP O-methyltransferase BioC [Candidatus Omnitrophica bacterium]|nr:malonyl-ACP O-methyltransferase BioC [Candidatus Omnitrophota bacterium]